MDKTSRPVEHSLQALEMHDHDPDNTEAKKAVRQFKHTLDEYIEYIDGNFTYHGDEIGIEEGLEIIEENLKRCEERSEGPIDYQDDLNLVKYIGQMRDLYIEYLESVEEEIPDEIDRNQDQY